MTELIKGGNAVVAISGIVHVALAWKTTDHVVETVCFGTGAQERVLS